MKNLLPTTKTIKRLGSGVVTPPNSFGAGAIIKRAGAFYQPSRGLGWRIRYALHDWGEALVYAGLDFFVRDVQDDKQAMRRGEA